jgi:hypothetical protein
MTKVERVFEIGRRPETFGWLVEYHKPMPRQRVFKFRKDALKAAEKSGLPESCVLPIVMAVCKPTDKHI